MDDTQDKATKGFVLDSLRNYLMTYYVLPSSDIVITSGKNWCVANRAAEFRTNHRSYCQRMETDVMSWPS